MTVDNYSVLEIMSICGKDLPNVDFFKKQDPYIHFEIGPISKLTRVDKGGGRNPQWNHRTRYENLPNPVAEVMKVKVMDDELIGKPKLIAECEINLEEIFQTGDKDGN
jgi:Ca2+-dependent lipid-binding protein